MYGPISAVHSESTKREGHPESTETAAQPQTTERAGQPQSTERAGQTQTIERRGQPPSTKQGKIITDWCPVGQFCCLAAILHPYCCPVKR